MSQLHRHRSLVLAAAAGLCLQGCLVGPDYQPPATMVPDVWHQEATNGLANGAAQLRAWWTTLNDPVLDSLIRRAGQGNLNLQGAVARIEEARAARGISQSQFFPNLTGQGAALATRSSEETTPVLPPDVDRETGFYRLGADAAWEADLWGRIRRSVESAEAGWQATIEDYRDLLVVLYAEVASTYVELRTLQLQLALTQSNADLQRDTLKLVRGRYQAGLVPELDVQQGELNLAQTESAIPVIQQSLAAAVHRLGVLVGETPGALHEELRESAPIPTAQHTVTVGVPADLLRQRPDVRRAERLLAAQTARIGISKADLYPRLFLTGSLSVEAFDADNLFNSGSATYGFGPQVRWDLFSGGRIRGTIRVEEARTQQALKAYEQTVLLALEDVENAMVAYAQSRDRHLALQRAVDAAQKSVDLVLVLYRNGLTDFQNVLNMQQALAVRQDELAANEGAVAKNLVRVYKALGGGWLPEDPLVSAAATEVRK